MKLAVFGASGVTGGFAFDEAERRGLAPIAAGRDGANLRAFAERKGLGGDRLRFADAGDLEGLKRAFEGITHVVSAVAPFAQNGFQIAHAAAELGLGYTDSTGESGFMLRLIEELDPIACAPAPRSAPATGLRPFSATWRCAGSRRSTTRRPSARSCTTSAATGRLTARCRAI